MKRRLRKKHRVGEFAECGFELHFSLPSHWDEAEQLRFWDRAIGRIESLGLAVGGGVGATWDVFVSCLAGRGSVAPAQQQALVDWLAAEPDVSALQAGHSWTHGVTHSNRSRRRAN
jgi:uncharacterized protein